jgi:hypothetical protein
MHHNDHEVEMMANKETQEEVQHLMKIQVAWSILKRGVIKEAKPTVVTSMVSNTIDSKSRKT